MHDSCMKTITIEDDVYNLLSSLKEGTGDSFSKVLRRHVHKPLETAGELLDAYENEPPPRANGAMLDRLLKERGRRSRRGK
jgi:predicted CopG family antitoxin